MYVHVLQYDVHVYVQVHVHACTCTYDLICSPMIMPPSLYLTFSLNLVCNITWLILWEREYMPAGLGVIVLLLLTLIACVVISYRAVLVNMPAKLSSVA